MTVPRTKKPSKKIECEAIDTSLNEHNSGDVAVVA